MAQVSELNPRNFATVWSSAWLRRADFHRGSSRLGRALTRLRGWAHRARAGAVEPDYFSQLAATPGVPDECKARALVIIMHQRKLASLYRLLAIDDFAAGARAARAASTHFSRSRNAEAA